MLLAMLYIFFYNLGYGAMIWMTVVEILPQHVRSVAASLTGGFACLWYFLTTHTYRYKAIEIVYQKTSLCVPRWAKRNWELFYKFCSGP